jgi:hypothetical protein
MITKENIILFKRWVSDGVLYFDEYSHTFMVEENIGQEESEFYQIAPEMTCFFNPIKNKGEERYSFCYGQFAITKTNPILFEPKPAKLYKVKYCSYFNHEHHKSNLLSAICFASFHYKNESDDGMSYLNNSLSIAKVLNQTGNISEENTLIAAVLEPILDITFVKIESIEMFFGKHVSTIIEVLAHINKREYKSREILLKKLDEASDGAKQIQLTILILDLEYIATLDEKTKNEHLLWNDQEARVCESASSNLYHLYMVERSKFSYVY